MRGMFSACSVVALVSGLAVGQSVVVKFDGTVHNTYSPGAAIALSVPTSVDLVNIYGANSSGQVDETVSIGAVSITNVSTTGDPTLNIFVGNGAFPLGPELQLTTSGADLSGLTIDSSLHGKCRVAGAIAGNLTGAIDAGSIFRLQVGGNVSANITGRPLDNATVAIDQLLVSGSIGSGATVEAVTGNIQRVEAGWQNTAGDIGSSILALDGKIGTVTAPGIISISDVRGIQAKSGIDSVTAASVVGNITANENSVNGAGLLKSLATTSGGVSGNIVTDSIPMLDSTSGQPNEFAAITIAGDLLGNLHVQGNLMGGVRVLGRVGAAEGEPAEDGITVDGNMGGWVHVDGALDFFHCAGDLLAVEATGYVYPTFVRASAIGEVEVAGVATREFETEGFQFIADSIGSAEVGGGALLFFRAPAPGTTERRYMVLPHLHVTGSLSGVHHLWDATLIRIDGDFGEAPGGWTPTSLHLHQLDGTLTIGGSHRAMVVVGQTGPESEYLEHRLRGQVIVNAANVSGSGDRVVCRKWNDISLLWSSWSSAENETPFPSTTVGGGSVGRVPFLVYRADCNPPNDLLWDNNVPGSDPLLNTAFSDGTRSATMKFDGPVRSAAPATAEAWEKPVTFWFWLNRVSQWTDLTSVVDIEMAEQGSGAMSREIRITGTGELLPPGYYAVTVNRTPRDVPNDLYQYHVYCDGTLATVPPAPAANINGALEYHFRLWPDCDDNGVIDPALTLCHEDGVCCADLAGAGITGIEPDGAVTVDDLIVFLIWFEEGLVEADIDSSLGDCNPDGGVNIDDLLSFLSHFEAGC